MTLGQFAQFLGAPGVLAVFGWVLYRFFRSAVEAHAARADAYERAWLAERERSSLRDAQLDHIIEALSAGRSQAKEPL